MKPANDWRGQKLRLIAALASGLLVLDLPAEEFMTAEYRLDGGQSWAMSLVTSNASPLYREGEFAAQVSATNLSVGPHYYEVRFCGTNGVWSAWRGDWFRVFGETHLTAAEWFVDTDPGYGLGIPVALPADGAWDEPEEEFVISGIEVTNLDVGRHQLVMRAKDSNGDWGVSSQTTFYVAPPVTIAAAVWTTNIMDFGDPAQSPPLTNYMRAVDGAYDEDAEDLVAVVNTLALETNYCLYRPLYLRCQDSLGRWSTRNGLWFDAAAQTWRFDPVSGWGTNWLGLTVAPEVASAASPGNWNLVVTSNSSVTLDWNDCRGVSGYEVYFRASRTNPLSLLAAGFTYTTVTVFNLPEAGAGDWLVRSLGDSGCGVDGPLWHFGFAQPRADDSDHDGLPDAWERGYFASLNAFTGSTDRDGDGFKDWQEWVAGTSPTNRLDCPTRLTVRVGELNSLLGMPTVVLDWMSVTGRSYNLYYTAQLETPAAVWSPLDCIEGTGQSISYTNDWPNPVDFDLLEIASPP